jgi:hypothetical protein
VTNARAELNSETAPDDVDVAEPEEDIVGDVPSASETLRYFGADFDVDGIVRRLNSKNFSIPSFNPPPANAVNYAGFQRGFIWTKSQKDRFIESLLLGYPVPGIFLVEQPNREYLVLDGQQRLRTLQDFVNGTDTVSDRTFRLRWVSESAQYYGKAFNELPPADQNLLHNTFIQATVVIPKARNNLQGVYQLFERINSGGTNLQPQEIRVALYAGPRVNVLRMMNGNVDWRDIFGPLHSRLKDTELILRYLALREVAVATQELGWNREAASAKLEALSNPSLEDRQKVYRAPLNQFLNGYLESLGENGHPDDGAMAAFARACLFLQPLGRSSLRLDDSQQVNAAHADAVLVGLSMSPAAARQNGYVPDAEDINRRMTLLKQDATYSNAVRESTSHAASIYTRLELAVRAFEDL